MSKRKSLQSQYVTLRHATPEANLASILATGIETARSKGIKRAVWLHSKRQSPWAALHTSRRHSVAIESVIVIECRVPRTGIRRTGTLGLWWTPHDITTAQIRCIIGVDDIDIEAAIGGPIRQALEDHF